MRTVVSTAIAALALHAPAQSQAFANYAYGTVDYVTSTPSGIMFRLAGGIKPTNCASPPEPFFLIAASDQAMIALFLSRIAAGQKVFAVYTSPTNGTYCAVNQLSIGAI